MSYFTGETTPQETNSTETQADVDYAAKVKAEKGDDFDPYKGYAHAADHIANLERQIKEQAEDLAKQDYMKEVIAKLEERQSTPPTTGEAAPENSGTNTSENQPTDVEKIKELVLETLTEQERTNTKAQNLSLTDQYLADQFGTNAASHVETKRKELGMSKESLETLAAESPSAFMALIGGAAPKQTNSMPGNEVRSEATPSKGGKRDWSEYQKMRKENPSLYYSPRIQNQMLEDRVKLGDAFYS